jgi:hypothetical protein
LPSSRLAQVTEGSRRRVVHVQSGYDSGEVTRGGMSIDQVVLDLNEPHQDRVCLAAAADVVRPVSGYVRGLPSASVASVRECRSGPEWDADRKSVVKHSVAGARSRSARLARSGSGGSAAVQI